MELQKLNEIEKEIHNISFLKKDLKDNKKVVLFLGAGVNYSPNVDIMWNDILKFLLDKAFGQIIFGRKMSSLDYNLLRKSLGLEYSLPDENKIDEGQWKKVERLVNEAFPYIVQASIIKDNLKNNYASFIQHFLYSKCNRNILEDAFKECYSLKKKGEGKLKFHTLFRIAKFIILYPYVEAVVTYNYDNFLKYAIKILLEHKNDFFTEDELKYIEHNEGRFRNIYDVTGTGKNKSCGKEDFLIYHVHGFIESPTHRDIVSDNRIILSQDEFYENSMNVYSWENATQLHYLKSYTCIFSGSSLTDMTVQRMLYYAKQYGSGNRIYHLCAQPNTDECKDYKNIVNELAILKNEFNSTMGITPVFSNKGYDSLYKYLSEICINLK